MRRPKSNQLGLLKLLGICAVLLGGARLLACSSSSACTAGTTVACSCASGGNGLQTCQGDGTFGACDCQSGTSSSTGGGTSGGATGGGTTGSGTTGGTSGVSACGTNYGLGTCTWPEYCLQDNCLAPQNLDAQGHDAPASACDTSQFTTQGAGNLDAERADGGLETLAAQSAIITDLTEIAIQSNADCVTYIGQNSTQYQEASQACEGGNPDRAGNPVCYPHEAALLFAGHAYDPQGHFVPTEGSALDAQFYWMKTLETPVKLTDKTDAKHSGTILPGPDWSANGGSFIFVHCLDSAHYPSLLTSYPVVLQFADTGTISAHVPGNSFCTQWTP